MPCHLFLTVSVGLRLNTPQPLEESQCRSSTNRCTNEIYGVTAKLMHCIRVYQEALLITDTDCVVMDQKPLQQYGCTCAQWTYIECSDLYGAVIDTQ
jgi:hypothetical protein